MSDYAPCLTMVKPADDPDKFFYVCMCGRRSEVGMWNDVMWASKLHEHAGDRDGKKWVRNPQGV